MSPLTTRPIHFGTFLVNSQVFHLTPLSYALVNLKPILPGHVLVSPLRVVPRVADLTQAEAADLFLTVQRVSRMVERVFRASSINIAIQDGVDAGQSIPHVHAHIIPRQRADLDSRGGGDAIYRLLESEEGDVGKHQSEQQKYRERAKFPAVDADENRKPRSEEEMRKEAEWLASEMQKEQES
ncbi:HIT domain-containing protein [Xylona heveae TC161]|uniref:Bis(5'-adenosyl)-triphosphatase n=1 Tax=Xylona heveae (strain CBS 132557 / TC161) TaxID=1328760 RepID=A0A165IWH5_XYLHT|nr:HIT domain-containing protein [Xylona heveae TC161]KZF25475.1 HIT domain-containing protein [Xylona heveae TC161]